MNENICISKNNFFALFIILVLFTFYYNHNLNKIILKIEKNEEPKKIIYSDIVKHKNIIYNDIIEPKNTIYNDIVKSLPLRQFLENRDRSLLYDPLVAPEKRVDINQYPIKIQNIINEPTRGYPDNYQLVGIASREQDEKIIQLFGRATFPGSNQYEYYVTSSNDGFANKIPIQNKGQKEIMDNDILNIPEFNKGSFKVKIYNNNTPRYNPYL
jgi:hypothetical protein